MEKLKTMPKEGIEQKVQAELSFALKMDRSRFSSGSMMMTMAECAFTTEDGRKGSARIEVMGRAIQLNIDDRTWALSIQDIIGAGLDADAAYLKEAKK